MEKQKIGASIPFSKGIETVTYNIHKKTFVFSRNIGLITSTSTTFVKEGIRCVANILSNLFRKILNKDQFVDKNKLILGKKRISYSENAWHLNNALLSDVEKKTSDQAFKKQIQFLKTNYLAKAAPIHIKSMQLLIPKIGKTFQVGVFRDTSYHRGCFLDQLNLASRFNEKLALRKKSPLILTDTAEFSEFLPLKFTVFNDNERTFWKERMITAINEHIITYPKDFLSHKLNSGILFDLSNQLQKTIKTNNSKQLNKQFSDELDSFKKEVSDLISESVKKTFSEHPGLEKNLSHKKMGMVQKAIKMSNTWVCENPSTFESIFSKTYF